MKPATSPETPAVDDSGAMPRVGSEYMNAREYLMQVADDARVRADAAEETHHGSNDSDFGAQLLPTD